MVSIFAFKKVKRQKKTNTTKQKIAQKPNQHTDIENRQKRHTTKHKKIDTNIETKTKYKNKKQLIENIENKK